MYNIGILGHRIEDWKQPTDLVFKNLEQVLDILLFQYGKEQLVVNVGAEPGIDSCVIKLCLEKGIRYHLFLPTTIENMEIKLFAAQKLALELGLKKAWAVSLHSPEYSKDQMLCDTHSYFKIVEEANFCIAFWDGRQSGRTWSALNYALSNNKMLLNGFANLSLMTKKDLNIFA